MSPVKAIFIFLSCSLLQGGDAFRSMTFKDACASANAEKKIVMIDFYTTWCGPCKRLDKETWSDATVRAWLDKKAVALKIDAEKEVALAKNYHIDSYPSILFINPDGKEIERITGFRAPDEFIKLADMLLSGKSELSVVDEQLASRPLDFGLRMDRGRLREQRNDLKGALEDYLFCWDDGLKENPGYSGVRVSFLLMNLQSLANRFEPALTAMRSRFDTLQSKILGEGKASLSQWKDYNRLDELFHFLNDRTSVFDKLLRLPKRKTWARDMALELLDRLCERRRFDDAADAIPYVRGADLDAARNSVLYMRRTLNREPILSIAEIMDASTKGVFAAENPAKNERIPLIRLLIQLNRLPEAAAASASVLATGARKDDALRATLAEKLQFCGADALEDFEKECEKSLNGEPLDEIRNIIKTARSTPASKPAK
ncbi:MAG: thioredoxin fold domain-containing protein [Planctomycetes bacterium]|nr:thioredoxin fold domain-containing protein [Planctomycetota bacterium]